MSNFSNASEAVVHFPKPNNSRTYLPQPMIIALDEKLFATSSNYDGSVTIPRIEDIALTLKSLKKQYRVGLTAHVINKDPNDWSNTIALNNFADERHIIVASPLAETELVQATHAEPTMLNVKHVVFVTPNQPSPSSMKNYKDHISFIVGSLPEAIPAIVETVHQFSTGKKPIKVNKVEPL